MLLLVVNATAQITQVHHHPTTLALKVQHTLSPTAFPPVPFSLLHHCSFSAFFRLIRCLILPTFSLSLSHLLAYELIWRSLLRLICCKFIFLPSDGLGQAHTHTHSVWVSECVVPYHNYDADYYYYWWAMIGFHCCCWPPHSTRWTFPLAVCLAVHCVYVSGRIQAQIQASTQRRGST